jgi:cytochrome c oxidase cbb3-type subunit 3
MKMFAQTVLLLGICTAGLAFLSMTSHAASTMSAGKLFHANCARCHGPEGKGKTMNHTPNFTSPTWQAHHSNQRIVSIITNGEKGTMMPAWKGKLTSAQIRSLMHYIRSLNSAAK